MKISILSLSNQAPKPKNSMIFGNAVAQALANLVAGSTPFAITSKKLTAISAFSFIVGSWGFSPGVKNV